MNDGATPMEVNRNIQWNWGVFNVPTVTLCIAIAAMIYNTGSKQERIDARLEAIEMARASRSAEVNKILEALQSKVVPFDNLAYRVTVTEQGLADANRRVDRVGDSMTMGFDAIRKDLGTLATKLEVMDSKLQSAAPKPQSVQ